MTDDKTGNGDALETSTRWIRVRRLGLEIVLVAKWMWRVLSSRFLICPVLLAAGIAGVYFGQGRLQDLDEEQLLLLGASLFLMMALAPFLFATSETNTFHRKIELSALLGGGLIAVVTAGFLLNEYKDQRQARVTRAWDLLHKAREQADRRMDAALDREIEKRRVAAETALAGWDACNESKDAICDDEHSVSEKAKAALADLTNGDDEAVWQVRRTARGGNDGQIGAITTLFNAEVDLNGLVVDELYLQRLQLPGKALVGASFKNADLRGANLRDASLWDANVRGADLTGANLGVANLRGADLTGANLGVANLRGARFLKHPKELGARWDEANPPRNLDKIVIDPK